MIGHPGALQPGTAFTRGKATSMFKYGTLFAILASVSQVAAAQVDAGIRQQAAEADLATKRDAAEQAAMLARDRAVAEAELAERRQAFEMDLARQRFEFDQELSRRQNAEADDGIPSNRPGGDLAE